jgi:hypothetical protein
MSSGFRIQIDGQVLDNRGVAGELLIRRAEKLRNQIGDDVRVGRFAGFDLFMRSTFNEAAELVLRGKNSYSARVTDTAHGTIRSLEAAVQGFEERAAKLDADIVDTQKRGMELEKKVGAPFEHEERYHDLSKRQQEIEDRLDLTKNQAPSTSDSETAEAQKGSETENVNTEAHKVQRPRLRVNQGRGVRV